MENTLVVPQHEATQIFTEVIRDLTSGNHDIKTVLRRCQHACQLLSWNGPKAWFSVELAGYPTSTPKPPYRQVLGKLLWKRRRSNFNEILSDVTEQYVYDSAPWEREIEDISLEVWWGIDYLLAVAQTGHQERTGETKGGVSRSRRETVELERVRTFSAASFAVVVSEIERMTYEFASQSYTMLRYGNVLTDFWTDYRTQVDATLRSLNLTAHLDAIQLGLQPDNTEAWRAAVLECRNLLNDVANYLWQDSRDTYEHLPGDGQRGKLNVSRGKFASRLAAYVHQKGLRGTAGKFVRDEIERLAVSIRSLIALQSKAHSPISRDDAKTAALGTYFILGELAIKTDMQPVATYGQPAAEFLEPES